MTACINLIAHTYIFTTINSSFEGDGEGVGEVLGYGGNSLGVGRSVGGARRVPHTCSNVYKTLVTMPGFDLNIHE